MNNSIDQNKLSGGMPSLENRSRQINISNFVTTNSQIEIRMLKETHKLNKQRALLKNVLKNQIEQERKQLEIEAKYKEKQYFIELYSYRKKHQESMKHNLLERQIWQQNKEAKKQ